MSMDMIPHASAVAPTLNYDMGSAPTGTTILLLTKGGVLVKGVVQQSTLKYYYAWAPLPKRDKAEEARRGLKL
jgi:hypothetical protein